MPSHRDVTEEGIATALGFVAQVVQLMAAYLGEVLVYPITCIGSRSLIRDGISAMVGPRMCVMTSLLASVKLSSQKRRFPLFSKGVDTYRFEYGVFLLNKNIEMVNISADSDQWPCVYVCFDSLWRTIISVHWTCGTRFPI